MSNSSGSTSVGIGLGTLVFIVLLILKLTGNIAMSWFLVITSIIWAPLLAIITILGFVLVFGTIAIGISGIKHWLDQ